ncbi:MAG TPA: CHAD domain-containing protein [Candidatus Limnocylindrales bacterium]|nr:CHAD domain-containing protein [Candidatus Limnocylindrales bacterium]
MVVQALPRPHARVDPSEARWSQAATQAFKAAAHDIEREGRRLRERADVDEIHDLRVATRRARTTAAIFADAVDANELRRTKRELKRLSDRLGAVRDLDVMLGQISGGHRADDHGLDPLRDAWTAERKDAGQRLRDELETGRYGRFLQRIADLGDPSRAVPPDPGEPPLLVRHRAPAAIWGSFGRLLAFDIDAASPDPLRVHRMRIAAKRLRYTLETFEDALGSDAKGLIERIETIQDLAGTSHDAGVAARRARLVLGQDGIGREARAPIERFASAQERCAADVTELARRLASVEGPGFRRTLGRLIVAL